MSRGTCAAGWLTRRARQVEDDELVKLNKAEVENLERELGQA